MTGIVRPRLTHETVALICEMIEAGEPRAAVARRAGVSVTTVDYCARREGAVGPTATAKWDVRPFDADLVELSSGGLTHPAIARRLGLTASVVRTRLTTLARREMVAEARAGE